MTLIDANAARMTLVFTLGAAALVAAAALPTVAGAQGQTPYDTINAAAAASPVTATAVRRGVTMLQGSGGNMAVLTGPNGHFMVDTGISVSKDKILTALAALGRGPIRYAVNTHWHWDHTHGNGWVRASGATVIASPNAAKRLSQTIRVEEWQHTFTPNPKNELPNMLVSRPKSIAFGSETALIRPYVPGHTDGDLSVYFRKADVLVTGDTWWNGGYPFIDYVGGGSIDGTIRLVEANIAMAGPNTLVIPGHGPVGGRQQLIETRDMLLAMRKRIAQMKAEGMSLDQVVAARPTADLDGKWGKLLVDGRLFTSLIYRGV